MRTTPKNGGDTVSKVGNLQVVEQANFSGLVQDWYDDDPSQLHRIVGHSRPVEKVALGWGVVFSRSQIVREGETYCKVFLLDTIQQPAESNAENYRY